MRMVGALLFTFVLSGETTVKMQDLPPAVQAAAKEQTKNATLAGLSKEIEKGKILYEVATKLNGKSRDVVLDATGVVVETEDEVDFDSIPAAAKLALQKKAAGGQIKKVEKLTQRSAVAYEAAIQTKTGKKVEVAVNADGTPYNEK